MTRSPETIFTDYVRALDPGRRSSGDEGFEAVWQALGRVLRRELRRRGLWHHPPSYLGIYGSGEWHRGDWQAGGDAFADHKVGEERASKGGDGAFDELLADCFCYTFVHRLRSLKAQLGSKDNIEGLVFLNVRNFLHERQRRHDPIGLRTYEVLAAAVEAALDANEMRIVAHGRNLSSRTVLAFSPGAGADPPVRDLGPLTRPWLEGLMPDLVTSRGPAREAVVQRLRRCLCELEDHGIDAFRLGDVIAPLRYEVRGWWAALLETERGETAIEDSMASGQEKVQSRVTQVVRPSSDFEDRERFDRLAECIERRLGGLPGTAATRAYLKVVWRFMRSFALTDGAAQLPSARKMAKLLEVPRERLPALITTIGDQLSHCRAAISEPRAVNLGRKDFKAERTGPGSGAGGSRPGIESRSRAVAADPGKESA